jgi:tetratricopeptide (TPR) repeat protein
MRQVAIVAVVLGLPLAAVAQTSPKPLLEQAREAVAAGRYADALAAQSGAIAAGPEDVAARVARARLLEQAGLHDLAAGDYRVAVKLSPADAGLQDNLCLALAMANRDLDGALGACNAAVKLSPESPEALGVRGYLQLRRAKWAEAEKDYAEALSLLPADPGYTFGRGIALIHLGRAVEGRDEMSIATLASPTLGDEWRARGFGASGEILPARSEAEDVKALRARFGELEKR